MNLGFKTTNWHDIANRAKADAEVEMIIECGWEEIVEEPRG